MMRTDGPLALGRDGVAMSGRSSAGPCGTSRHPWAWSQRTAAKTVASKSQAIDGCCFDAGYNRCGRKRERPQGRKPQVGSGRNAPFRRLSVRGDASGERITTLTPLIIGDRGMGRARSSGSRTDPQGALTTACLRLPVPGGLVRSGSSNSVWLGPLDVPMRELAPGLCTSAPPGVYSAR